MCNSRIAGDQLKRAATFLLPDTELKLTQSHFSSTRVQSIQSLVKRTVQHLQNWCVSRAETPPHSHPSPSHPGVLASLPNALSLSIWRAKARAPCALSFRHKITQWGSRKRVSAPLCTFSLRKHLFSGSENDSFILHTGHENTVTPFCNNYYQTSFFPE